MKAIRTKYIGPSDRKGSRVSATTGEKGQRVVLTWDNARNASDMHAVAARTLADKYQWQGKLIGGGFPDGTMAWVFADSPDVA